MTRAAARQFHTGDECPNCDTGHLRVYHTHVVDDAFRLRFLWCGDCRHKPTGNKELVPLRFAPRRSSKPRKITIRRRR